MSTTTLPEHETYPGRCEGCENGTERACWIVTYDDGSTCPTLYCDDCAALVRGGWLPEIVSCEIDPEN